MFKEYYTPSHNIYGFNFTGAYNKMAGMAKGKVMMLTVKQAAARLGASEGAVRAWCIAGRLPGAKKEESPIGEYWLIPESALRGMENRGPGRPPKSTKKEKPG
jgi:excisionase family DNA binding protein